MKSDQGSCPAFPLASDRPTNIWRLARARIRHEPKRGPDAGGFSVWQRCTYLSRIPHHGFSKNRKQVTTFVAAIARTQASTCLKKPFYLKYFLLGVDPSTSVVEYLSRRNHRDDVDLHLNHKKVKA